MNDECSDVTRQQGFHRGVMITLLFLASPCCRMDLEAELHAWEATVPEEFRRDVIWTSSAYRLATFAADFAWADICTLAADARTVSLADQLSRSIGSIGANYSDGYSRASARDRVRFFEYSLAEARESRDWYYKARHVTGAERSTLMIQVLTRIVQLLTVTVSRERAKLKRLADASPLKTRHD